jgi:hypothetical protein
MISLFSKCQEKVKFESIFYWWNMAYLAYVKTNNSNATSAVIIRTVAIWKIENILFINLRNFQLNSRSEFCWCLDLWLRMVQPVRRGIIKTKHWSFCVRRKFDTFYSIIFAKIWLGVPYVWWKLSQLWNWCADCDKTVFKSVYDLATPAALFIGHGLRQDIHYFLGP